MAIDIPSARALLMPRPLAPPNGFHANEQAVRQFNAYLAEARQRYPDTIDIQALQVFSLPTLVDVHALIDAIHRLQDALNLESTAIDVSTTSLSQKFGILRT